MMRKARDGSGAKRRTRVRIGRPPQERAGEVDERILDAARFVFLERGLAGASIDEIARLARAGKPTIYSRFSTKQDLFVAVGMRNAATIIAQFGNHPVKGATLEERLISIAGNILERLLQSDAIDFLRLSVAEARRFPEVAQARHTARERAAEAIARLLSEATHSDETKVLPAFAPQHLAATTQLFLDLVTADLFTRALFGDDLEVLRAKIDAHVRRGVAFFLAACRHGWAA